MRLCRRVLKDELGVAPSAEINALLERIRQRDVNLLRTPVESVPSDSDERHTHKSAASSQHPREEVGSDST